MSTENPYREADAAELRRRITEATGDLATLRGVADALESSDKVAAKWLREYVAAIRETLEDGARAKWRTEMDERGREAASRIGQQLRNGEVAQ